MELSELMLRFRTDGEEGAIRALHSVDRGIDQVDRSARSASFGLGSLFKVAGGFLVGAGFIEGAKGLLMLNANAEQAKMSLETVTGSQEKANALFKDLQAFAASTPFEFPELVQSAINLESFGLKTNDWIGTIGDTASAMGKDVDQVTQAVLDAQTGQFERLKELGIMSNIEGDKVKFRYMKDGKEIVETVDKNNQEIINSTIQGIWNSKYEGAMEKQSNSFLGRFSTLKDNVTMRLQEMTNGIFNFASTGLGIINDVFANGFYDTFDNILSPATIDFLHNIQTLAGGIIAAFGEGAPISQILAQLPESWRRLADPILRVADAFGDVYSRLQSGGLAGAFQQLGVELRDLGGRLVQFLISGIPDLGRKIAELVQNTDVSGVGEAMGRIAREMVLGLASWLPQHWQEVIKVTTALVLALPAAIAFAGYLFIPKAAEFIQGFVRGLEINWSLIGTWLQNLPGRIVGAMPGLLSTLSNAGYDLIQGLSDGAASQWQTFSSWLNDRGEVAASAVGILFDFLRPSGIQLIEGLWDGATAQWDGFTGWLAGLGGSIVAWVGDLSGMLWNTGYNAAWGLASGITAGAYALVQPAVDLINGIIDGITDFVNPGSPSRRFLPVGESIPWALAEGMKRRSVDVSSAIASMQNALTISPSVSPAIRPSLSPTFAGGGGSSTSSPPLYIDMRGAFIGRGVREEIQAMIDQSVGRKAGRLVTSRSFEGARS